jgi:hypothetical protein
MILAELTSEVRKILEGSISSSDSRFNSRYLDWIIPQLTSQVIVESYTGTRTKKATKLIDPDCWMHLEVTKVRSDQSTDNQFTIFNIGSSPVVFDNSTNGLIIQNRNATGTFIQVRTRQELQMAYAKGFRDGSTLLCLATGSTIEVYGSKAITKLYLDIIPENPLDVTANLFSTGAPFDPDTDAYPFPASLMNDLAQKVKERMLIQKQIPADTIDNETA